ncbi:uncharacterized protein EI90DRAFT_3123457 [Cantharellus anzutake]|uniref:uncharacterized protein n=1 Tax=Cantharellus anzutake TaxID=1750568 RepID=UPI001902D339|nr:uncharacterized protein EI90DRAFT_3123457 [Cantharellus anzutake]KAF8331293.1 hypothetical protein EI90DRAFT_3123457 [Cantharellus anzutake]
MASPHMLEFLLNLPLCASFIFISVYAFNQPVKSRQLLYSCPSSSPSAPPYSVICAPAASSRGPSYLVSFSCPSYPSPDSGPGVAKIEVFTVEIRKDYWGRFPAVDWLSLVVDGAQKCKSFEYP